MWSFNQNNVPSNALFLEEVNNIQTFDYLCECIEWLIINQAKTHLFNMQKINYILKYFIKYLLSTRRYTFTISFFNKLLHFDLNFAKFAIKPLKLLNLYNDTMTYLAKLCTDPNIEDTSDSTNSYMCNYNINSKQNPKLLWLEIDILTKLKQYDDALKIAKYVTSMTPKNINAWLSLAELYLKMNQHENFLRALNNIFIMDNNNINSFYTFFGKDDNSSFCLDCNLYNYNKKSFSVNEIPISFGNQKLTNLNQNLFNSEHKYNKKIIDLLGLKINDLFSKQKHCIDIFYSANKYDQFNIFTDIHDESEDFFQHITLKILNSNYISFSHIQKKIYNLILSLIKEINFEPFMTLKKKIFSTVNNTQSGENFINNNNNIQNNNSININDLLSGKENSSLNSNFNQIQSYSLANEMKLLMNPNLEFIIETLIDDLKIFSIVMNSNFSSGEATYQVSDINNIQGLDNNNTNSNNDKNNNILQNDNTLNMIKNKDELTIKEIKFCLSFALLNERLGYRSTALNLYRKAQENCFSRFLLMRKIKIFIEEKNFKQAIMTLGDLLSFIKEEEFNYVNKTPLWIDDIILKTLFEYQVNDIMEWLDDCEDYIWEYVKKIVNKYKYWIDVGQDIYLVK